MEEKIIALAKQLGNKLSPIYGEVLIGCEWGYHNRIEGSAHYYIVVYSDSAKAWAGVPNEIEGYPVVLRDIPPSLSRKTRLGSGTQFSLTSGTSKPEVEKSSSEAYKNTELSTTNK